MQRYFRVATALALLFLGSTTVSAGTLASIKGAVRDATGTAVPAVALRLDDVGSSASRTEITSASGEYTFANLEAGRYHLVAAVAGFRPVDVLIDVNAGEKVQKNIALEIAGVSSAVTVTATNEHQPVAPSCELIDSSEIDHIPGALRAGSLAAVVDSSPSAVLVHDQLHVRGGHQVGFQIDGVPVPSTGLGSNFSLLFDPSDVKAIEVSRGAYSAEYGDHLDGQVNVVTRSGFEQQRSGEAMIIVGEQATRQAAVSYGSHTDGFAHFSQVSANRTDAGLTPPTLPFVHDQASGIGAATKLWAPVDTNDLLTLTALVGGNNYQIPPAVAAHTGANQLERDGFVAVQWHHAGTDGLQWSLTPYYRFSRVALDSNPAAGGGLSSDDRATRYAGAKADAEYTLGVHELKVGFDAYGARHADSFVLPALAELSDIPFENSVFKTAFEQAFYFEDFLRAGTDFSFTAGVRWNQSRAYRIESAWQPRVGATARLFGSPVVAHAYIGRFFQVPPLEALGVGGSQFVAVGDRAFLLVHAERNTQWETGVSIPFSGGTVDLTYYRNNAVNFLDHEQLGESAVFLPVNLAGARMHGLEISASSAPAKAFKLRVVYALGYAEAHGPITGGLGDVTVLSPAGYFFLDHDQRHSAVLSAEYQPSDRWWAHVAVRYGSGFVRQGTDHLPSHLTSDVAVGVKGGARWSAAVDVENVTNAFYYLNLSTEFNGTHVARPRTATARLRVSF